MVGVFKRSISFPSKNSTTPKRPTFSHHIRSVSLPSRSHPLFSHLTDEINQLRAWSSSSPEPRTSAWLCDGLSRLKDAHDKLDDILQLPQSQATLRRHPYCLDDLLDHSLRFADAYGTFQTSAITFNEDQLSAQLAIRKRNDAGLAPFANSCKKISKEMSRLASYVVQQKPVSPLARACETSTSVAESELVHLIGGVIDVTVSVSVALFDGLAASFSTRRSWRTLLGLLEVDADRGIKEFARVGRENGTLLLTLKKKKKKKKKKKMGGEEVKMVLGRFREMEECVDCLGIKARDVLRSLIRTRVSLLNTLT